MSWSPSRFVSWMARPLAGCALAALTACGAGSGDATVFVGTWTISNGTLNASCGGLTPSQSLDGSTVTLANATDGSLVANVRGCQVVFDVKGNVATARANQTCQSSVDLAGQTLALTLSVAAATFTVSGDTGTLVQSGTATTNTFPLGCVYQVMATAQRGGPSDGGAD